LPPTFFALNAARDRVNASPGGALRSIVHRKRTEAAGESLIDLILLPKADATTTAEAPAPAAEAPAPATAETAAAPKPSPTKPPAIKPIMPGGRKKSKKTNKKKKGKGKK